MTYGAIRESAERLRVLLGRAGVKGLKPLPKLRPIGTEKLQRAMKKLEQAKALR